MYVVIVTCTQGDEQFVSGAGDDALADDSCEANQYSRENAKITATWWLRQVENLVTERGQILVHIEKAEDEVSETCHVVTLGKANANI